MAKKIYRADLLQLIKAHQYDKNDFVYYTLRLIAHGRSKIILAEKTVLYSQCYGSALNQIIIDFLEEVGLSYTLYDRPPRTYFDSPILVINQNVYDENGSQATCR